jgi:putative flippase GtrA
MNGGMLVNESKKQQLMEQIMKFGIVGGVSFLIDFIVYTVCVYVGIHYLLAGALGFMISLVFNYLASMAFVFQRKDGADRKVEFVIFLGLSAIGLLINEGIIWLCIDGIYKNFPLMESFLSEKPAQMGAKIIATGIVMIYNFISRKVFIEKKEA